MKALTLLRVAVLIGASTTLPAQSSSDWRLVGGTPNSYLFFDAAGIRKLPNEHLEVWLKGLPAKPTEKAAEKILDDKAHLAHAASKIASGYAPPISLVRKLDNNELANGVAYEEVADAAEIQPEIRMLVELDCANRIFRTLSLYVKSGGKTGSTDKPGDWEHIAPETNFTPLQMALCPKG